MSTFVDRTRQPSGRPAGGQYAAEQRESSGLSLATPLVVADHEARQAQQDYDQARAALNKAEKMMLTRELGNVVGLAQEHGHDASWAPVTTVHLSLRDGLMRVERVQTTQETHDVDEFEASEWAQRLNSSDLGPYYDVHPLLHLERSDAHQDHYSIDTEKVMKAASNHQLFRAGDQVGQARQQAIRAGVHQALAMLTERIPEAKHMVLQDRGTEGVGIAALLDTNRHEIAESDEVIDVIEAVAELDVFCNYRARDFAGAGIGPPQIDEGEVTIDFDRVRRLRGVADAANQPSLFGADEDLGAFGWTG